VPRIAFPLLLAALPTVVACSDGTSTLKPAGISCSTDGECAAGLSCENLGSFSEAGCTPIAKACSRLCSTDSDCAPLGSTFKCFSACDGTHSCGATQ
jgi:hypothetical protein